MTTPGRRLATTWALLLAGPVVGTAYFLAVYLLAEASCATDVTLLDTAVLRIVIVAAGAGALAVFAGYALRARRLWRTAEPRSLREDNDRFMITTALMLLGLFALFVLFIVAPAIGSTLC